MIPTQNTSHDKPNNIALGLREQAMQRLVIWLNKTIDLKIPDEHNVEISIIPDVS
jgi:hypothetical protein